MPATAASGTGAERTFDYNKLATWRETAGLRREDVCAAVGLSYNYLRALETGRAANPSLELLSRLARYYGHDAGELLTAGQAS